MSDLLKRIGDYFTNCYQGDDKTAPTMEINVTDLRYIANMNVERCIAEAELRNIKYNKCKDCDGCVQCKDVCEWELDSHLENDTPAEWLICPHSPKKIFSTDIKYCPYCAKKIKVVE